MAEYLDWFVDREKQYNGFQKMLARKTPKQIMLVKAPAEMGKTWLIQRLRHESRSLGLPVAHFNFRDRRAWDYLAIVREARDQLGPAHFKPLTQAINASTTIHVQLQTAEGGGAYIEGNVDTGGGDFAGRDIIKDNFFLIHTDSETTRRAIEIQITDAFFTCMELFQRERVVVVLFDSYEEVTSEADRWLQAYLLAWVRDGRLPNVVIVLAGRATPELDDAWLNCLARTGLERFTNDEITDYILRRGLADLDLNTIFKVCGGHPGLLGKMADIATLESQTDDDWL